MLVGWPGWLTVPFCFSSFWWRMVTRCWRRRRCFGSWTTWCLKWGSSSKETTAPKTFYPGSSYAVLWPPSSLNSLPAAPWQGMITKFDFSWINLLMFLHGRSSVVLPSFGVVLGTTIGLGLTFYAEPFLLFRLCRGNKKACINFIVIWGLISI